MMTAPIVHTYKHVCTMIPYTNPCHSFPRPLCDDCPFIAVSTPEIIEARAVWRTMLRRYENGAPHYVLDIGARALTVAVRSQCRVSS